MRRAFALYERGLRERPVLTNSVVAATLMGSGDAIQQLFFERRAKHAAGQSADYNLRRSLSMGQWRALARVIARGASMRMFGR
jgi:hypothetical protein